MSDLDNIATMRLVLLSWYKEFYEPDYEEYEIDRDVQELIEKGFSLDEVIAGVKRYRDTYLYGRTRNWAHLLKSIMEIRKESLNVMPAGMAAELFTTRMSYNYVEAANTRPEHFKEMLQKAGYGKMTGILITRTHRKLGDSIQFEDVEYVTRKFIKIYEELTISGLDSPPLPALEPMKGLQPIKKLAQGAINDTARRIGSNSKDTLGG